MIDKLIKLADYLDKSGFKEETDGIDALIKSAGRLSDALGKYPESENKVKKLYGNLPQRLLKYFAWAAEELIEGPRTSIEELVSLLGRFDDLKNTSKIKEQIPNLQDYPVSILRKVIEGYGKTSKEERRTSRAKRDEESVIIYNSDNFKVILPKTQFASCQWTGKNTKWCISAEDTNMYDSYANNNVFLYHILNKDESISDKDPLKRIAIPTNGNLGILDSEVRDATDEWLGAARAREVVGEEFEAIKKRLLEHSGVTEFTDNISEDIRTIARKIKNDEEVTAAELVKIIKLMKNGDSDTYWFRLVKDSLSTSFNLVNPILSSSAVSKQSLTENFLNSFELGYDAKKSNLMELFGIEGYIMDKYEVDNSKKLDYFTSFFNKDADSLEPLFPKILKHLLSFAEGKRAVFSFIVEDLTQSEVKMVLSKVDGETLLLLYNSMSAGSGNMYALESMGELLVEKGIITQEQLDIKIDEWASPDVPWLYDEDMSIE